LKIFKEFLSNYVIMVDNYKNKNNSEMADLNKKETTSLNTNPICLVRTKVLPRKTPQDKERNCLLVDIDKAIEILKKGDTYYECFYDNQITKVYLDIERDDYEEEPTKDTLESIKSACIDEICRFMNCAEDFNPNEHIAIAQRHRWIEKRNKKTFKVSYRFWITNLSIVYSQIPTLLKELGVASTIIPVIETRFDMSCYNKGNQLINAIWNCKEDELNHPLTPITNHDDKAFITQYTDGTEHFCDVNIKKQKEQKEATPKSKGKYTEEEVMIARKLISILSKHRADNYQDWIRVGWLAKAISDGLLDSWIEFSKTSYKFVDGECEKLWNTMRTDGNTLGMGTLRRWAKQDNPQAYNTIVKKKLWEYIRLARSGTEYDIALVVKEMYGDTFAYENRSWYAFVGHRWMETEDGIALKMKLPTEVANEFRLSASYFATKATETEDADEKERLDTLASDIQGVVKKLKKAPFQASVMTECAMLFYMKDFKQNLDEKHNLIAFENGVYDLDTDTFRDGEPEDFISKSTLYNFTKHEDPQIQQDIMDFFTSIQHSEEMRDYLLDTLAINLHGTKKHQLIIFWVGKGGNGKGVAVVLYQGVLGEYMYTPPIQIYTTKRKSASQANPEIAKCKGVRGMVSTEPEEDDTLYMALMKSMTGGDKQQGRALYDKPIEFVIQAIPMIQMNKKPILPSGNDGGVKRRLRLIHFPFNFVEKPTMENERPINLELGDKFKQVEYHQQFMLILLERYKKYRGSGYKLHTPKKVSDDTQAYLDENNHVKNFIDETYEKGKKEGGQDDDFIYAQEMLAAYNCWAKENSTPSMTKKQMNEALDYIGYKAKPSGRVVKGVSLRGKCVVFGLKERSDLRIELQDEYDQ
jgi:P4 family phage/plasmid primase-like protien